MSNRIPLSLPNIDQDDLNSVLTSLQSNFLSAGPMITAFEQKLAKYLNVKEVVAVSSATTGIELSLAAYADLNPGDEVLVPAFTFPACINSVLARGLKPRLVDIDPISLNMDVERLSKAITRRTKAIIPVDAFGNPCEMGIIEDLCKPRGIRIIRDSACALGSKVDGRLVGSEHYPVVFSFHQRKIITTGEGGCVTTNDSEFADRLRRLRSHGIERGELFATFVENGFNFRMSEMQASLGVSQMEKLDWNISRHAYIGNLYRKKLSETREIDLSSAHDFSGRVLQSFIIKLNNSETRDKLIRYLREIDVESTIGTYDLSCQPAYSKYVKRQNFPEAQKAGETTLALPVFANMSDLQVERVCAGVKDFFMGKN